MLSSNYWIWINGKCASTTSTLTWAMWFADAMANDFDVPITVMDHQGKTVYEVHVV